MAKDYIPVSDAEFDVWLRNLGQKLPAIATAIGIPQALVNELLSAIADWNTAYKSHQKIHNEARGATENKNGKRAVAKSVARLLVGVLQTNPGLTDGQREIVRITVPDRKPTPLSPDYVIGVPPPTLILDWSMRGQVIIHFGMNPKNEHENAKPENIAGAKLWHRVGEGEWQWLADDTNSPYTHKLDANEPMRVAYRGQWFDKKMRVGPLGNPVRATVSP